MAETRKITNMTKMKKGKGHDITEYKEKQEDLSEPEEPRENESEKVDKRLPIDKGWAWMIVVGATFSGFVIIGHLKCYGIMFVAQQARFGSSSSATAIINTVQSITFSISGLLVMTLGSSLPARTSVYAGAAIACFAYFCGAFVTSLGWAYLFLGFFSGIANAFIHLQFTAMISTYFSRLRGFANSISQCGVSVGGLILAPLLTYLFQEYGFTGTYIFVAGFHFNVAVFGSLLRPLSFYERKPGKKNPHTEPLLKVDEQNEDLSVVGADQTKTNGHQHLDKQILIHTEEDNVGIKRQHSETPVKSALFQSSALIRPRCYSESQRKTNNNLNETETDSPVVLALSHNSLFNSNLAKFAGTDLVTSSLMDLTLCNEERNIARAQNTGGSRNTKSKWSVKKVLTTIFDLKLLSKREFLYFLLCNFFLCGGSATATIFLPQHCQDRGIDQLTVAWIVGGTNILELISRFVFGALSVKDWCHRSTIMAGAAIVIGVVAQLSHFMTDLSTIIMYASVAGFLQGVYFSLFAVVILDILTFKEFKGALGFTCLVQGAATSIVFPIAGYLRDTTGSYYASINYIGCMFIIGAVLVFFLPNVHDWSRRRRAEKMNSLDCYVT